MGPDPVLPSGYVNPLGLPCNKTPQTGWFKQQKCIIPQSWRPEVQGQGVGRFRFSKGLSPWATFLLCLHKVFPLCVHPGVFLGVQIYFFHKESH